MTRAIPLLLAFWILLTTLLYLWPLNLHVAPVFHTNDAAWSSEGVSFASNGMLRTGDPPRALHDRLVAGGGLTVEAWVTPASASQTGPARIVTYSEDPGLRNFTLGQEGGDLVFRLRTSPDDPNGVADQIFVPDVLVPGRPTHVAVVYDLAAIDVYVDGALRAHSVGHDGSLGAWSPDYELAVGNELTGDRPWRGTIAAVAIDARPRSADEILVDFQAGPGAIDGATAAYDFTERSSVSAFTRPFAYLNGEYPDLLTAHGRSAEDFVFNFGLFAVMGWLAAAAAGGRNGPSLRALLATATALVAIAVLLESGQIYVDGRTSSLRDLTAAIAGGLAGLLVCAATSTRNRSRRA